MCLNGKSRTGLKEMKRKVGESEARKWGEEGRILREGGQQHPASLVLSSPQLTEDGGLVALNPSD